MICSHRQLFLWRSSQ